MQGEISRLQKEYMDKKNNEKFGDESVDSDDDVAGARLME